MKDGTPRPGRPRWASWGLLLALIAIAAGSAGLHLQRTRNRAELAWVRGQLPDLSWEQARLELSGLEGRLGVDGSAAAAGLMVRTLVDGTTPSATLPPADLAGLPVRRLLERALEERRFEGALRVVSLLRRADLAAFADFEAAALLELGRIGESRRVELGGTASGTLLGRRLSEMLNGGRDLRRTPIRDRSGDLLGWLDTEGSFEPAPEIDENLVPRMALDHVQALDPSGSVRLTLDLGLSRLALRALAGYRGSIVIVDPRSGDVLVAASDERTWREGGSPALEQMREPASIAKLITVTAALRAGIDVEAVISEMRCRGSVRYGDEGPLYCSSINGPLRSLDRALAVSCNVAFAELGHLVGRELLLAEFSRYGFDLESQTGVFGQVLTPQGSDRQLGELAIGLEATAITPVHAALQAAAFGNGGFMSEPRLVLARESYLGFSSSPQPEAHHWRVVDQAWLPGLVRAMEAVAAPGGTAALVSPRNFPVALKTGTASDPLTGFHVNYIGFGPTEDPRYAFAVRLTHQRTSQRVRRAAYAVTHRLLGRLAGDTRLPLTLAAGN